MSVELEAVLWDMDGTLVDSEPAWFRAQERIVRQHGGTWGPADADALIGSDLHTTVRAMQAAGAKLSAREMAAELTREVIEALSRSVDWRPGARELIAELAAAGVPQAIVTTSTRAMTCAVVAGLPRDCIRLTVTADDVATTKPSPEPYLRAAAALKVDIERCVVVEDSRIGLAAGVASGAHVIGIPHDIDLEEEDSWTLWSSLSGRGHQDMLAVVRGEGKESVVPDQPVSRFGVTGGS